jgi:inner membrane protein
MRSGHVGVSLLCYTPFAVVITAVASPVEALAGGVLSATVVMLPDVDIALNIPHRGPTHTIWFVGMAGMLALLIGFVIGRFLSQNATTVGVFCSLIVASSITSHLIADALTERGIRPFQPLSRTQYSFGVASSKDVATNVVLIIIGVSSVSGAILLASGY